MLTLSSSHKLFLFAGLILSISLGCRKEIDFEEGENSSTTGKIDPSQPILEAWEYVNLSANDIDHITSDGQNVYYSQFSGGMNRMYKMDTSGVSTFLFDISTSDDVFLMKYDASKLYFTQRYANGIGRVHEFDETGILNTYEIFVSLSYGTNLTTLLDLGSELFVAGRFRFGNDNSWSSCLIDKATGTVTTMPGLGSNTIKSAVYFENEIYVVGKALFGNYSSTTGVTLAKWNGSQWQGLGPNTAQTNYLIPPSATGVGHHNGQLILGGGIKTYPSGVYRYNSLNNNFLSDQRFTGTVYDIEDLNVVIKMINNDLYACGDIRFTTASFNSVYVLNNNTWRSIGALDASATDLTICQGYAFALVDGYIKRYPL